MKVPWPLQVISAGCPPCQNRNFRANWITLALPDDVIRPICAPDESDAFGFERFTELKILKNSERNCTRWPSLPGMRKFLNTARFVVASGGPINAFRPTFP